MRTIWISGTMHNILFKSVWHLNKKGFKIINNITWKKLNPPPNISCRFFVHSTETILWAKKDLKKAKHKFNYSLMRELNDGKQMKDVWESSLTKPHEKMWKTSNTKANRNIRKNSTCIYL